MPDTERLLAQNNDGALLVAEPAALLIPVGRYVGFLWFVVVSRTLWRRDGGAPSTGRSRTTAGVAAPAPAS
ncbi:hypothetical protein [Kitasatospora sp. NPDC098663]|uniref:hypothetical protein n=1 Tax=Kitasatospora sp. NPDC098663 TaxID=3364096 RepID=UPI0037FE648A